MTVHCFYPEHVSIISIPVSSKCLNIGLSARYMFSPPDVPERVFSQQVQIAVDRGIPITVHTREAAKRIMKEMRSSVTRLAFKASPHGHSLNHLINVAVVVCIWAYIIQSRLQAMNGAYFSSLFFLNMSCFDTTYHSWNHLHKAGGNSAHSLDIDIEVPSRPRP
ncbi:hypothetical protein IW261DRAFT_336213 [Armillaria novae-zelandiae]|uniref:Uncharacterized protein n=1 Tax=Armillaria novae-zelandiae TaxID=153914 RepID=A0AA39P4A0_9AGAR|nr:hypothetical protein IW261DRAFT_336213 [Armillaria novae-zelandiae]